MLCSLHKGLIPFFKFKVINILNIIKKQIALLLFIFIGLSCSTNSDSNENSTTTVTDVDGNVYPTVIIGTQTWTKTNLNVSHYRNGDVIPQVTDPTAWANLTTGAWCYYNNDPANGAIYGKLYNWYAANDSRGLAPIGYHIPTDAEWTTLTDYLGGLNVAGGKMKENGINHWKTPNTGATNESNFTGRPGGYRNANGTINKIGEISGWWSLSVSSQSNNYCYWYVINYTSKIAIRNAADIKVGSSVRCLKD